MAASGKTSKVKFQCHVEQRLIGSMWTIIKYTNFKIKTKVACGTKNPYKVLLTCILQMHISIMKTFISMTCLATLI